MTSDGFESAKLLMEPEEWSRLFYSTEEKKNIVKEKGLNEVDFQIEMIRLMSIPFGGQHVNYQFRQKIKLTDIFGRPKT